MKIDPSSSSLDCDKDPMKVIYSQKTPNRKSTLDGKEFKMAAVEDQGFLEAVRTTQLSADQRYDRQRADESFTSGPPFFLSDDCRPSFVPGGNPERAQSKNKELEANKAPINNSSAPTGVSKPALLEPIGSHHDPDPQGENSPSMLLSLSLPSNSLLLLPPRGNALSLPPSPLLAPCESPATSSSLTSLLERRRSKPGLKSLGTLSIFNSHNSPLDCNPKSLGQPPSKYDHHDTTAKDKSPETTPTTTSTGQFPVKILSDLYLGNAQTSADLHCLQSHNIGYIVNVTSDVVNSFEGLPGFQYLRIPIADDSWSQDMEKHFRSAINFIDEGRKNNQSILIHCMAGVSRSVTVTVAYLMKSENLSMDDAYELLRRCKSNINPNLSLMGQLQLFGEKLKRERLKNQQHLLDVSSLSINQAAAESLDGQETPSLGESKFFKNGSTIHEIKSNSHNSALITPETATFTDFKPENPVFYFPCTPPATPSLRDHFGIFQNRAMSLPNGNECEEL